MVEDEVKYQYNFIKSIIDAVGPRLAGSESEQKAAQMIAQEHEKVSGKKAIVEQFTCAQKASIGFIPAFGYLLFVFIPLYFLFPLFTFFVVLGFLVFAFFQIFRYKGWFDFLFPQVHTQNVYTVLDPKDLNPKQDNIIDFTVVLSAHIDSSWNWKILVKNPTQVRVKITSAVLGALVLLILSLIKSIDDYTGIDLGMPWIYFIVLAFIPSWYFLSQFLSWNEKKASPGAMDDLSGVSIGLWIMKYFKEHPEKVPKNCRIIVLADGAEEVGTKGSRAFCKQHKDDLLKGNVWVMNIDSISDYDFFQVCDRDSWMGTHNDPDLCKLAEKSYQDLNIKYDVIDNPVGSTDAATYALYGIRSVTLSAQDPGPASNYHTYLDDIDHMDFRAVAVMNKVVLRLIENIDEFVHTQK